MKNFSKREYDLNSVFNENETIVNLDDITYDKEMSIEELEEVASRLEEIRIDVDSDQIEEIDKKLDEIDDLIIQKSVDSADLSDKDLDDIYHDEGKSESDFDKWVDEKLSDEDLNDIEDEDADEAKDEDETELDDEKIDDIEDEDISLDEIEESKVSNTVFKSGDKVKVLNFDEYLPSPFEDDNIDAKKYIGKIATIIGIANDEDPESITYDVKFDDGIEGVFLKEHLKKI